jgi:hypothetical protein
MYDSIYTLSFADPPLHLDVELQSYFIKTETPGPEQKVEKSRQKESS